MKVTDFELAREIADFMKRLCRQQLTTALRGDISVRRGDEIFITPDGVDRGWIETDDVGRIAPDGRVLDPGFKPSCGAELHLAVYRQRPDITAIVHAYPVTADAFSASDAEIRASAVSGKIGRISQPYSGMPVLAEAAADRAKECDVLLLKDHGAMAFGTSLLQAFDRIEVLENAAKITLICEHLLKNGVCTLP